MLARTPYTEIYLRSVQAACDEKMRRQRIAAAKPKLRQLNRDRHRHLVETVAGILRTGQPTYFAYEGAVWHGLRSSLCLQGWAWHDADAAAADVVGSALRQIGAVRPTWQQGQIGYTEEATAEHERCANSDCGKPVVIGLNGRPRKYCSTECMGRHHSKMAGRHGFQRTRAEYLVACAADRARKATAERDCAWCGKLFVQGISNEPRSYCCDTCRNAARAAASRKHPTELNCAQCGSTFRPRQSGAKFCSKGCMAVAFSRPAKPCEACGTLFRPKQRNDEKFCGPTCRYASYSRKPRSAFQCEAAAE